MILLLLAKAVDNSRELEPWETSRDCSIAVSGVFDTRLGDSRVPDRVGIGAADRLRHSSSSVLFVVSCNTCIARG